MTFNYGNKDKSPLENVKFYQKDTSVELPEDEVSILGHLRNSIARPSSSVVHASSIVKHFLKNTGHYFHILVYIAYFG